MVIPYDIVLQLSRLKNKIKYNVDSTNTVYYKSMKELNLNKILWLTLICMVPLFAQRTILSSRLNRLDSVSVKPEKYGPPYVDPFSGTIDEVDSGAVLIKSDRTVQKFATIKSAVESADANSTIIVYPGTYTDSLTIGIENLTITGISAKSVTISGAIFINASRGMIENCRITGNLTLLGQAIKALYYVKDCLLENNINIGTPISPIVSNVYFTDCLLGTDGTWITKTIYMNVSFSGAPEIYFHQCHSPVWATSHNLYLKGATQAHIEGSTKIAFNSITINGGANIDATVMLFYDGCNLLLKDLILTGFTEISCINSLVTFQTSTTIANNCEFDLFNCKIQAVNHSTITFNSTLHSRWDHCTGTTNIDGITGSGLNYLHIQYSFFQQITAPVGLASDDANTWGVWVDY
jgi:pectin methylesterase-like acyl-CoA thioesterase